jgi:hypothetical protein
MPHKDDDGAIILDDFGPIEGAPLFRPFIGVMPRQRDPDGVHLWGPKAAAECVRRSRAMRIALANRRRPKRKSVVKRTRAGAIVVKAPRA